MLNEALGVYHMINQTQISRSIRNIRVLVNGELPAVTAVPGDFFHISIYRLSSASNFRRIPQENASCKQAAFVEILFDVERTLLPPAEESSERLEQATGQIGW